MARNRQVCIRLTDEEFALIEGSKLSPRELILRAIEQNQGPESDTISSDNAIAIDSGEQDSKLEVLQAELVEANESGDFWFKDSEDKDSEIEGLNTKISELQQERSRLMACYNCKPALDYLLVLLEKSQIENYDTLFFVELNRSMITKYENECSGGRTRFAKLCDLLSRAYGRSITIENIVTIDENRDYHVYDFESLTGVRIP